MASKVSERLLLAGSAAELKRPPLRFAGLLAEHEDAWTQTWDIATIQLKSWPNLERELRFAQFHLLSGSMTGEKVTPTTGHDLRVQPTRIQTAEQKDHTVAHVAWAVSNYVDWAADED